MEFVDHVAVIIMLAIGAIAGCVATVAFSGFGFGLIRNIIVGILGAIVAGFFLSGVIPVPGLPGQMITATIGAIILLLVVGLFSRRVI
jgi:uncharacterized membrane protein YeaQ/YmgE (transglycosylase-associated protein family)